MVFRLIFRLRLAALAVGQSDRFGRRFLSSERLAARRLRTFRYRWSRAVELQRLGLRRCWNGSGSGSRRAGEDDPTTVVLTTEAELDGLVERIVAKRHESPFAVGNIARDRSNQAADDGCTTRPATTTTGR